MPKSLRYGLAAVVIAVALVPLFVMPGIAESLGWERSTGSTLGAWITIALFLIAGAVSVRIIRHREDRRSRAEVEQMLRPYRDQEQ